MNIEIDKIDIILNKSYESDIGIGKENYDYIMKFIIKQQKEIEELTLDLEEMTKSNNHKKENWVHKNILNSYISKDKMREKIKEIDEILDRDLLVDNLRYYFNAKKEVLQELLEEK